MVKEENERVLHSLMLTGRIKSNDDKDAQNEQKTPIATEEQAKRRHD